MANFTQNISGVINCFGPEASTKWGAPMTFGAATWGDSTTSAFGLPVRVICYHNDTGPTFADLFSNRFLLGPTVNTATFMQNGIRESLRDNSGNYYYVLPGGVTNDENAFIPTYTSGTNPTFSWVQSSTSSTTWTVTT